jgi:hypothetical protein
VDSPDRSPETGDAVREQIAHLEAQLESLSEALERCDKISLIARGALIGGAVWLALIVLGIVPFAPFNIVGAIAALLGGTVLFGSNASTWKQTTAAIAQAEALRAELIGRIALQTVDERESTVATPQVRWLH